MIDPMSLPPKITSELPCSEGTLHFTLESNQPMSAPEGGSLLLLEVPALETITRLELLADATLRFTRATQVAVAVADVDVSDLVKASTSWQVYLVWSPAGIVLHVGDTAHEMGLRSSQ